MRVCPGQAGHTPYETVARERPLRPEKFDTFEPFPRKPAVDDLESAESIGFGLTRVENGTNVAHDSAAESCAERDELLRLELRLADWEGLCRSDWERPVHTV